ncbi:hypothetical protein HanRHA438_Chr13g0589531 [Helianthus annuus]|nr:hypothetical protein HanRHA438_Chr13g0589531 [Helianthus annuus]
MNALEIVLVFIKFYKASGYGDGPSLEDDPSRRRHVIVLPMMVNPPKLEGMGGWS